MMTGRMPKLFGLLVPVVVCLGLSACGDSDNQELKDWMKKSSKDIRGSVPPLPEIKPFPVIGYDGESMTDPFRSSRIEPEKKPGGGGIHPPTDRRKEPLESFPLESLKMVGTLKQGKTIYAMIQADKTIYQIHIGNYMGQNFGRVTDITDSEIKLKELVEDSAGDWGERETSLMLVESQQGAKK